MSELSVIIPARCEEWLSRTIQDILEHMRGDTEVIAVCDGNWPEPPIEDHPKVHLIYHSESIGQRAATNEAARMSTARYIMKVDAHCSFDDGFDVKLMEDMQDDWAMVPIMRNLHVFDWVCENGHRRYQGPSGACTECGQPTKKDVVWRAKPSPQSKSYCFDSAPHFQYFPEFNKRPEGQGELTETMSLQGSCFMMTKDKFFELGICDESLGSWGSMGIEVAGKVWLSGGKVMVNQKTFYAHCFRTQGGDFGFPYPLSGRQVESAKKGVRDLFFENKWPHQIHPLSWLVEKFWPVRGWAEEDLARLRMTPFPHPDPLNNLLPMGEVVSLPISNTADGTTPRDSADLGGEEMSLLAMSLPSINKANRPLGDKHMLFVRDELEVEGVTTGGLVAGVMKDGNPAPSSPTRKGLDQPGVDQPMTIGDSAHEADITISPLVTSTSPNPAFPNRINEINFNLGKDSPNVLSGQRKGFREILTGSHDSASDAELWSELGWGDVHLGSILPQAKGIVYYTDNELAPTIAEACQKQLVRAANGIPIIAVSLKPVDFGDERIVINEKRGIMTMFKQILAGLEACKADVVYFAEHDMLYHGSHFQFTPPRDDIYYYNQATWKVDSESGQCLFYYCNQTSGLVAYRDLLLRHYRERVRRVEQEGFSRKQGFEPGTHNRKERIDDIGHETFMSEVPNIDIRHNKNLTPSRWKQDQFRNKRYCQGWMMADEVPGWGIVKGRFDDFLMEMNNGAS